MNIPKTPPGVPSPYVAHVHPYPTRFHGGIWTRPVFGMPRVAKVQSVFRPVNFDPPAQSGLGDSCGCGSSPDGLGDPLIQAGDGVFRYPRTGGGGIFNRALAGPDAASMGRYFVGAVAGVLLANFVLIPLAKRYILKG